MAGLVGTAASCEALGRGVFQINDTKTKKNENPSAELPRVAKIGYFGIYLQNDWSDGLAASQILLDDIKWDMFHFYCMHKSPLNAILEEDLCGEPVRWT